MGLRDYCAPKTGLIPMHGGAWRSVCVKYMFGIAIIILKKGERMKLQKILSENKKIRVLLFFTIALWLWVLVDFLGNQIVKGKDVAVAVDFTGVREEALEASGQLKCSNEELEKNLAQMEKSVALEENGRGKKISVRKVSSELSKKHVYQIKVQDKECGALCFYPAEDNGYLFILEIKQKTKENKLYSWKEKLDKLAAEYPIEDWQSFYYTSYPIDGKLTKKEQEKIGGEIFKQLSAEQLFACQLDGMVNWYGNTEKIKEQIHTNDSDINVQLAFTYEEGKQRTRCYIGTPVLNNEY